MSKYKPATNNDMSVIRRNVKELRRKVEESITPSGTQKYGTTGVVRTVQNRMDALDDAITRAEKAADTAESAAESATEAVGSLQEEIDAIPVIQFPVSTVIMLTSSTSLTGLPGTWSLIGQAEIGGVGYYLWEKTRN